MNDLLIQSAIEYISMLFKDNADGHDCAHSIRVYQNAIQIAQNINEPYDEEIVALASLLHDVDDHKLFQTEDNANARAFLASYRLDPSKIEKVISVINGVSFSKNRGRVPESIEGRIVQDADRLDAMGAIGIARTFAYGGSHGRDLDSSIMHFHEKLLLLQEEMNTSSAKEIAKERHAFMRAFLDEYEKEVKG